MLGSAASRSVSSQIMAQKAAPQAMVCWGQLPPGSACSLGKGSSLGMDMAGISSSFLPDLNALLQKQAGVVQPPLVAGVTGQWMSRPPGRGNPSGAIDDRPRTRRSDALAMATRSSRRRECRTLTVGSTSSRSATVMPTQTHIDHFGGLPTSRGDLRQETGDPTVKTRSNYEQVEIVPMHLESKSARRPTTSGF